MLAYIDANLIIYLIDQNAQYAPVVKAWLAANPCDLASSDLGRLEALILPVRNQDQQRIAEFEAFFQAGIKYMAPFTRAVYDRAIQIRAVLNLKAPDALHMAAAIESSCDVYVTKDHHFKKCTGITVEVI